MNFYKKIIISSIVMSNIIGCQKNECLDGVKAIIENNQLDGCLLYTSDADDDP